jgi:hypothetical protein
LTPPRTAAGAAASANRPGDWLSDPATPETLWRAVVREAGFLRPAPESEEELFARLRAAHRRLPRCSLAANERDGAGRVSG